jgi:nitrogen fixation protein NifX
MQLLRRLKLVSDRVATAHTPAALHVGFATTDLKRVNQHFGATQRLGIFEVTAHGARLVEISEFAGYAQDGDDTKLATRIQALGGATLVYVQAIGASATHQLVIRGVQPRKVPFGTPISQLLAELRRELHWLEDAGGRRRRSDPARFDAMAAEGWRE